MTRTRVCMKQTDEEDLTRNLVAEREVIGTIMAVPALAPHAMRLRAEDFSKSLHSAAWRAIAHLLDRGDEITVRSVSAACGNAIDGRGRDELADMARMSGATGGILAEAVDAVTDASKRRSIAETYSNARRAMTTSDDPIASIVAKASAGADDALMGRQARFLDGRQVGEAAKLQMKNPNRRIPTRIEKLDFVLGGGLDPGRMLAIISKSKIGKSTFVATVSHNLTEDAVPNLVITLERDDRDMIKMCAARHLDINVNELEKDFDRHEPGFDAFINDDKRKIVQFHHAPGDMLDDIRHAILTAVRLHGVRVVFIDYYQIIAKTLKEGTQDHLTRVAQTLANLTAKLGICLIITAQSDIDGMPRECKALHLAAAANFVIRRAPEQVETWLENIGSNYIEQVDAGSPSVPAMLLDKTSGPHFRSTTR